MAIRLDKPWRDLTEPAVRDLPGQLGVFQIADQADAIVLIGFAGGRSLFGLRGELDRARKSGAGTRFRYEVTMQYLTRYQELLMVYLADHGRLPVGNRSDEIDRLGRLSPGAP